jgi:hypothetical protein
LIRLAIMTSLSSGAAVDAAIGPYMGLGELPLAVKLLPALTPNDILVADRYYLTYFFIALAIARGADFVTRHFDQRQFNVIERRRINKREEILVLKKPQRPHTGWLDRETYEAIPETIVIRKSQVKLIRAGQRDEWLTIITTLTNSKLYTQEDLADIYLWRWQVELDIRVIKRLMGLNIIGAKTPEMIAKEFWARLLAYNIIRAIVAMAARRSTLRPRQLSFKACLGLIIAYQKKWRDDDPEHNRRMFDDLLLALSGIRAGHRPDRHEPRAKKRRADRGVPMLNRPRKVWKKSRAS